MRSESSLISARTDQRANQGCHRLGNQWMKGVMRCGSIGNRWFGACTQRCVPTRRHSLAKACQDAGGRCSISELENTTSNEPSFNGATADNLQREHAGVRVSVIDL